MKQVSIPLVAATSLSAAQRELLPGTLNVDIACKGGIVSVSRGILVAFCAKARALAAEGELKKTFTVAEAPFKIVDELIKWAKKACAETPIPAIISKTHLSSLSTPPP